MNGYHIHEDEQKAQIKRGKASQAVIQRSIAGPTVLAKLIYDKFIQYLPLYRQVKEWERYGLLTNDKKLSNWVIRVAEDFLSPVYEFMKQLLTAKSLLHVDETYAQIIHRSDGKSGQPNAYNWFFRSVPCQGPTIILFHSSLSRSQSVLETFTADFKLIPQIYLLEKKVQDFLESKIICASVIITTLISESIPL